jgi:hypothetical protein
MVTVNVNWTVSRPSIENRELSFQTKASQYALVGLADVENCFFLGHDRQWLVMKAWPGVWATGCDSGHQAAGKVLFTVSK